MGSTAVEQASVNVENPGSLGGPILVATDGMPQSDGALAVARALAGGTGCAVGVVTVQRLKVHATRDPSFLLEPGVLTRRAAEQKDRVCRQCAITSAEGPGPVLSEPEVSSGDPERVLARLATARRAALIVVGLGHHEVIDRIFGSETALKICRVSRVPVLAVPAQARKAPRRAVVGLDFSGASLEAARAALRLLSLDGELHLVHVIPQDRLLVDPWMSDGEYDDMVRHRFARFRSQLTVPPHITIEQATCSGNAARALVDYAERHDADMIAAGSHGHGVVSRLALGSVTTALLRAATTAVLVVPGGSLGEELEIIGEGSGTLHLDPSQWTTMLADFTRTNAGRRTRLEIDDPEIGAQAQEVDYPLRGVAFDPHDQRLEVMLGAPGAGVPHHSRSIDNVRSLDLLTANDGTDVALRVQHGTGQTVITFLT